MIAVDHVGWLDHSRPECGPLDAIVRPTMVAPCTSDVRVSHGWAGQRGDIILGHEAVGVVDEVGALVAAFKPGDLVAVPCVTPDWLSAGVQHPRRVSHDTGEQASYKFASSKDGVMAEYFHVNQADANLARIPDGVAPEAALMAVDMMPTALRGVEVADVSFGETVVVIGIGPVGLLAIAGAALRGAGRVIAVGTRRASQSVAMHYGASEVVSYRDGSLSDLILARTGGSGADKAIVAGGDAATLAQAVRLVRPGGIVSNINFFGESEMLQLPIGDWGLGMADIDIRGSFCPGGGEIVASMMQMIRYGRIDPTLVITHRFDGWDALPKAFQLMDQKPDDLIKPVVVLD